MRTLRSADLAGGAFFTILGILTLVASTQIEGTAGERLHPRTLPVILGWAVLAGGLALLAVGWQYRGVEKLVEWPGRVGRCRVLVTVISTAVYMALLEPLGFPLATLVFIFFLTRYLGRYRWWTAALCGLGSGLTVLFLFIDFLGLSFPLGLLELLF